MLNFFREAIKDLIGYFVAVSIVVSICVKLEIPIFYKTTRLVFSDIFPEGYSDCMWRGGNNIIGEDSGRKLVVLSCLEDKKREGRL